MHYAFDAWVRRELAGVEFCRYADDGLLHCKSQYQANRVLNDISRRFKECGLEIHPDKSGIIYCKDSRRKGQHKRISFDYLGFEFRPRESRDKLGRAFCGFLPAMSKQAKKTINQKIRSWCIPLKNSWSLEDLSKCFNKVITGWVNYYGRFYPSALEPLAWNFSRHLIKWVNRKYKRFKGSYSRAKNYLAGIMQGKGTYFKFWATDCVGQR